MAEHRQTCRPVDTPSPRKRNDFTACFSRGLLVTAQTVDLDSCLLRISGIVLLSASEAQPSGTRREHEPNGCGVPMYEAKKGSRLMSMANCRRVGRKVNRKRTAKELLERM